MHYLPPLSLSLSLPVPLPEPELLQEVLLPLMDTATCEALYSDYKDEKTPSTSVIKDDMMCAGYMEGKRDACQVQCIHL